MAGIQRPDSDKASTEYVEQTLCLAHSPLKLLLPSMNPKVVKQSVALVDLLSPAPKEMTSGHKSSLKSPPGLLEHVVQRVAAETYFHSR